jgi:hypothetical protein
MREFFVTADSNHPHGRMEWWNNGIVGFKI